MPQAFVASMLVTASSSGGMDQRLPLHPTVNHPHMHKYATRVAVSLRRSMSGETRPK
ncbi:hypothetical protein BDV39DRAFT_174976 [Aspergillus sergii]|uniref:Uncharacterized protein n=1 Tax=Aspergillus sergii TaxID=1034303 RepID=A0A5N6X4X3_9EURO|nr:hypothetical protein BDV39DRAFT_174976 [Aspergillus sergii]